jgi:hypothetical protein
LKQLHIIENFEVYQNELSLHSTTNELIRLLNRDQLAESLRNIELSIYVFGVLLLHIQRGAFSAVDSRNASFAMLEHLNNRICNDPSQISS